MAGGDTTRMLVLGATRIFEPANGYQLRRELLSWEVDSWANVQPGSIYSMLATLTKLGLVERIDLVTSPGGRPVAVYRTTAAGRAELLDIVRAGIEQVHAMDSTEFYAAMSLVATCFGRKDVLDMLAVRAENLRASIAGIEAKIAKIGPGSGTPPHVAKLMEYARSATAADLAWVADFTATVRAGELYFLGEDELYDFDPAADDPAWRMLAEREVYLRALEALGR
jgi:DNA-binding PadR family transcriptional regulator